MAIPMDHLFIHGRVAVSDAADLIARFGAQAPLEAASRAAESRNAGNVSRFCHWRQIERVIDVLSSEEATGTLH
jgi:hypothetical protein